MTKANRGGGALSLLQSVYTKRGPAHAAQKKALLGDMRDVRLSSASLVARYHDILMFLVAFPDDAPIYRAADAELRRVAAAVCATQADEGGLADALADTGIAYTAIEYAFSAPIAEWLADSFGTDVDLAWHDDSVSSTLDQFGHLVASHMEQDALLTERHTTRELFELFKGPANPTVLAWLLHRYRQLGLPSKPGLEFYNLLDLPLHWRLEGAAGSRTFARLPKRRLRSRPALAWASDDLEAHVAKPLPAPATLDRAAGTHIIGVARAMLCARHRETEAVTHPNPDEVVSFAMEGGIDVVLLGMAPEYRLATESFFGLMAASNGVPIAYGGGFVYRGRLDLGLNIFKEFRGGDSSFVYAQILRVFCQYFACRYVVIDSAQFGYGRPGGIASGAFWFYYKLGFRPTDAALAQLAADEAARVRGEPGYRTPAATLREFTNSDLALTLAGGETVAVQPHMADIALAVSRHTAARFAGDRQAATAWARRRVRRVLGVRGLRGWPVDERRAFLHLCDLVALIEDLGDWPDGAKRSLVTLMRAKGGAREHRYVQLLARHRRLAQSLAVLAT